MYSGLQVLSERSAMATRALDYIGDILKHIKPSLVSKNQEGLQLVYWAVGTCLRSTLLFLFESLRVESDSLVLVRLSQGAS